MLKLEHFIFSYQSVIPSAIDEVFLQLPKMKIIFIFYLKAHDVLVLAALFVYYVLVSQLFTVVIQMTRYFIQHLG